ncbi:MAG: hypothetical protein HOY69_13455 [Streptomyces sp.]|nr:hypothetical protein [Streptomyces sp.]
MPTLRLSPEIQCHATWLESGGRVENVAPGRLPVPPELAAAIVAWGERWDAIYDMNDPASAAFASEAEELRFWRDGEELAARLRAALGPDWTVTLFG